MKALLELRKKMKRRKPDFVRQDIHKKTKLSKKWRKPKGYHAKMRQGKGGRRKTISTGYGTPKKVRGLTKEGLKPVLIRSLNLEGINAKEEGIIISSKLGSRKRVEIIKEAQKKGIAIINIKNADEYLKKIEDKLKVKEEQKKKRDEKKKEKEEKEKKKEAKDLTDKLSEEEKKEKDKIEKDKLLTKRESK